MAAGTEIAAYRQQALSLPASLPALPDWVQRSLSALTAGYPNFIPKALALTPEQRPAVLAMIEDLDRRLSVRSVDQIAVELAKLFSAHPQMQSGDSEAELRSETFLEALEDFPPWAVTAARKRWTSGKVTGANLVFAPAIPQFCKLVADEVFQARAMRVRLQKLLEAEPLPELTSKERAAAAERVSRTARELFKHTPA